MSEPRKGPWEHAFVTTNGVKLHYVIAGPEKAPLMVLLHGFPQFWYAWRHQIPELAKSYRVVALDMRGYAESEKPPNVSDYRMDLLTGDVAGLIRALGREKAIVVGHDWGAAVAWATAFGRPEVVEKLVILNVPHPAAMAKALKTNFAQMRRSWYIFFFQLPWIPEWRMTHDGAAILDAMFRGMVHRKDAFTDTDIAIFKEALLSRGAARAMINYYRATMRDLAGQKRLAREKKMVKAPTLVLWGEDDTALGKEMTVGMDRYVAAPYEIRYVPDCSHWIVEERPAEVTGWILEFAGRAGAKAA